MLNPPDPRPSWNDQVSPTSPSSTALLPRKSRAKGQPTEENAANDNDANDTNNTAQLPTPDPTPEKPSTSRGLPLRITTSSSDTTRTTDELPDSLADDETSQLPNDLSDGAIEDDATREPSLPTVPLTDEFDDDPTPTVYAFAPPIRLAEVEARTPTPTSAEFKSMLESYDEIPKAEVPQLLDLANAVSDQRIEEAKAEMRGEDSPLPRDRGLNDEKEEEMPPTPTTAELRSKLNGYKGLKYDEVRRLVDMADRITATRVRHALEQETGRLYAPLLDLAAEDEGPTAKEEAERRRVALKARIQGLELRVMQKLLPAKILLQRPDDKLPPVERAKHAAGYAYEALSFVRTFPTDWEDGNGKVDTEASEVLDTTSRALQGRCAYYAAVAEWVMRQQGAGDEDVGVLAYFHMALQAREGGYREGEWAEGWVEFLRGGGEVEEGGEENGDGGGHGEGEEAEEKDGEDGKGWGGWLISKVKRLSVRTSVAEKSAADGGEEKITASGGEEESASGDWEERGRTRRREQWSKQDIRDYHAAQDMAARGPSASSDDNDHRRSQGWESLELLSSGSSGSESEHEDEDATTPRLPGSYSPPSPPQSGSELATGLITPTQLRSPSHPNDPDTESSLPRPVTSPRRRTTSIHFDEPLSPSSGGTQSPKRDSIYERRHSRKSSLLETLGVKFSGREKRRSEIEEAEEGQSPFGGKFPGGESEGLKKRKVSLGVEAGDMV